MKKVSQNSTLNCRNNWGEPEGALYGKYGAAFYVQLCVCMYMPASIIITLMSYVCNTCKAIDKHVPLNVLSWTKNVKLIITYDE